MRSSVYYKYYKEMLGAMGTIAYEVQAQFGVVQDVNGNQNTHTYQQQEKKKQSWANGKEIPTTLVEYIDKCETNWIAVVSSIINDYLSIFTICESNSIWCCIDRVIDWRRWDFLFKYWNYCTNIRLKKEKILVLCLQV